MIKSLNILRHEVMKQNGRLTDDKKHKKVKKNLTALTELFDELIDVITELKLLFLLPAFFTALIHLDGYKIETNNTTADSSVSL